MAATGLLLALNATAVVAQEKSQTATPPDVQKTTESTDLPTPPPRQPRRAPVLHGLEPVARQAQTLVDKGFLLRATLSNDLQGNPVGGLDHHVRNGGTGSFGADVDLGKTVGLQGGELHILFVKSYGGTVQDDVGNYIKSQGWYYPFQKFQLAQFAYEQDLFDGKINILAGRTNETGPFARPTYGCKFISGGQCPFFLPLMIGGFTGFPLVTWGGRIQANLSKKVYLEAGVYSIDPNRRLGNGFDLGLDSVSGANVPVEIGYSTDFSNDKYPRHFKLGGWLRTAPTLDPRLNVNGQSRAIVPGAPLMHDGDHGGAYAIADQVVYRFDGSQRNVALFASISAPFGEDEVLTRQGTLGALATGPVASRPRDTAGIQVTWLRFSDAQTLYMNELLAKKGSTSFVDHNQYAIEANYSVEAAPGIAIAPNVEYLIHPDTTQRPDATRAPADALIVGVRVSLNVGAMLGLPFALPSH